MRDLIYPAWMKWLTAQDAPQSKKHALTKAVLFNASNGVIRTSGVETASWLPHESGLLEECNGC